MSLLHFFATSLYNFSLLQLFTTCLYYISLLLAIKGIVTILHIRTNVPAHGCRRAAAAEKRKGATPAQRHPATIDASK
jgi:hypothetical protein